MTEQNLAETLSLREAFVRFKMRDLDNRRTIERYREVLNRWESWTANPPVGRITNETLAGFREQALAAGRRPNTVRTQLRHLITILRRIGPADHGNPAGEGVIPRVPFVKLPGEDYPLPRIVPLDDLSAFYDAADVAVWPDDLVPPGEWWRCVLAVVYNTCVRRSDLLAIGADEACLETNTLKFRAKKTGKRQIVPLNAVAAAHVRRLWSPRPRLFGKYGSRIQWYREFDRIVAAAGIDDPFTIQDVRRTGLTAFEATKPGTASYLGGHLKASQLHGQHTLALTRKFYIGAPQVIIQTAEAIPQPEAFLRILQDGNGKSLVSLNNAVRRTDWRFDLDWVEFRGERFRITPRTLTVLRAFVAAGRPLGFRDLREVAFYGDPEVSDITLKRCAYDVRKWLLHNLSLPAGFNPLRWMPEENGWLLRIL